MPDPNIHEIEDEGKVAGPERIVAIEGMGQRHWTEGEHMPAMPGIFREVYVRADIHDEAVRKMGRLLLAAEVARAVIDELNALGPHYRSIPILDAAIAECE